MKLMILAVGKVGDKFLINGIREYMQRLKHYTRISMAHVKEEKISAKASMAEIEKVKEAEGKRLLSKVMPNSHLIALSVRGESLSSLELAQKLRDLRVHGRSNLTFIIGGPHGLSDEVLKSADDVLSFSQMTFTHEMIRLILLEQIYRAFKIIKNEPYHKG